MRASLALLALLVATPAPAQPPARNAHLRAKIFGLNAAKVYGVTPTVRRVAEARDPHFLTYGPKTRREFLRLRKLGLG
jgi:hypothetical protein